MSFSAFLISPYKIHVCETKKLVFLPRGKKEKREIEMEGMQRRRLWAKVG